MAASDDFKQLIRAGNVAEALQLAFTEAIELTITTRLTPANGLDATSPLPQIQTRIDLLAGTVTTDVSPDVCTHESYAALGPIHSDQVREGCQVIQDNLANLQNFLATWIDVFGKSGNLPTTTPTGGTAPAPAAISEPIPVAEPPAAPATLPPEVAADLGAVAIAPFLSETPPPEPSPPVVPASLSETDEATTIESELGFEEETFIQSQEPGVDLTDLSLPTPPTEATEAAAAIAMDELFGEPQDLAVSQEAVEAAARELASAGADLGFDEETFVQALEPPTGPESAPVSLDLGIGDETFIQDLESPAPPPVSELEAPAIETLEPEPPASEVPESDAFADTWSTEPEVSEPEAVPDEMWAEAADMVDDSWLEELEGPEPEPTPEPEADLGFAFEAEPTPESTADLGDLGFEAEPALASTPDLGFEAEPAPESEADFDLEAATGGPEMATDALVDALLQADLEAGLPTPEPTAPVPPAPAEPDFEDLSWATAAPDQAAAMDVDLDRASESEESDWDELSAFADTDQSSDPWEAVEAAAIPDWLTEEETPAPPTPAVPEPEAPEILEDFDPNLFADEAGGTLETAGSTTPIEDAFLSAFHEEELAAAAIAPEAEVETLDTVSSLDSEAAFAEFDAVLFPDDREAEAAMPDLDLGTLEELAEPTDTAEVPAADPLAGLFSDADPSTAELAAEMEDFMPTAIPDAAAEAPPTAGYDPLAALFDESGSEDFANILNVPEELEGEDPLAAFDVDPFADEFNNTEEPT